MKHLYLFLIALMNYSFSFGQYVVNFEGAGETKTSYSSGNVTLNGIQWNMTEALIGDLTGDYKVGSKSARLRGRNGSSMTMNANKSNGLGNLSFTYRIYGSDTSQQPWAVEYSTNNGSSWTQIGSNITATNIVQTFNQSVNVSGNVRIRIRLTTTPGTSGNRRFNIDDITLTDFASASPTINLSESALSGLDYVDGSGPSAEQTFTAAGSDLTDDITITAPTNFEVSLTSGSGFGSSVTLNETGGTVATTTIYVRLASGLAVNTYSGTLTATSTGATQQDVSLSGEVTPAPPVNDDCANATPLTVGSSCSFSTYTNENGSNSGAPAPGCASYGGSDVWFSVVVPASGNLEIDTNIGTITDGGMAIYSGTCGSLTLIECDDDDSVNGLMPALSLTGLTPSDTLYILFWEFGGNFEGTFDICVYEPVPPPIITLSETTLSGLDYVDGNGPSAEQTFTAAGSDLTADITITAPTNFEVSTTSGSGFGSSVTLTETGGTVATTTIYVRLASGLAVNTYSGTLTATSTGATQQDVSLSGEVTFVSCAGTTTSFPYNGVSGTTNLEHNSSGNPPGSSGEDCGDNYLIYYNSTPSTDSSGNYLRSNAVDDLIESADWGGVGNFETFAIDVSGETSVVVETFGNTIGAGFNAGGEEFQWWYTLDGGPQVNLGTAFTGTGSLAIGPTAVDVTGINEIIVGFTFNMNGGSDGFEDVDVTVTSSATPSITLSESTISELNYISGTVSWPSNSFTASGANLNDDLTITAPANFEISLDDSDFSINPIVLSPTSGSVSPTTIYVRLAGSLGLGNYTGTLTATSTGATTQNISLEGDVMASQASDIIAVASSEAATISSLINDTAPLGSGDGVQVWQITVRDGRAALNDADNLPTILTAFTLAQGSGNAVGDWAANIETVALFDGSTFVATGTVTATQIQFTGLNVSVADNTQKTLSLRLSLKCPLTEPDGDDFVFSLSDDNTTFSAAGSGKDSFSAAISNNGSNVIEVVATDLIFVQEPTNTGVSTVMIPAVTVAAADACGNIDIDFTGNITLTSTGTLTGSPVTEAAVAGVATFSNLIHTVVASGRTLEATSAGLVTATSASFDVLNITVLDGGDLAIVAINTDIGGGLGADEVCFMAFKDIIPGTSIEFTDNGFERVFPDLWGDSEGTVRFTYSGSTITAGTTICIQGQATTYDFFKCGVNDNSNWTITNLNGATQFNLNGTDQIWILQNGTWINPAFQYDASYTGNFVWGWTAIGWESEPGYNSTSGSTIPEGFTCFNSDVNGVSGSTDKVKYTGPTDTANQSEWISRINNSGNWTGYADNAAYNAQGPNYAGSCESFSITAGGFAAGLWTGDTNSNWFDCGNWDNRKVPDATTNVTVNSTDTIVINEGDAEVNNITIISGGVLTIGAGTPADGSSLTVFGTLTNDGTLTMQSASTSYSSLLPLGNVVNTGTIEYERHTNQFNNTPGSTTGQNDLVSPPLSGQTFASFRADNVNNLPSGNIGGVPSFLFGPYDNLARQYVNYNSGDDNSVLESGIGYRTASTNNSSLLFTGEVVTGTVEVTIDRPTGGNMWNLIGNPYPSYISLEDFMPDDSSNELAFAGDAAGIYGYDGNAQDGWWYLNKAYRDANPGAVLAPGQGFFVASRLGLPSPTITFTPSMRRIGNADDFIPGRSNIVSYYLKIELSSGNNKYYSEFYFNPNASRVFDVGYDNIIWGGTAPNFSLYSHLVENNTGLSLAVQSVHPDDLTGISIPLGVNAANGAPLSFRIVKSTLPETINVILEDTYAQSINNLNNGTYSATHLPNGNGTGRFYLGISDQSLTLNEGVLNGIHLYTPLQSRQLVVAGYLDRLTTARLYDLQGRLVQEYALQTGVSEQALDVRYFNAGVYVVVLDNGVQRLEQKVILD